MTTPEELMEHMQRVSRAHLEIEDELIIVEVMLTEPARMLALLAAPPSQRYTDAEFAAFVLKCAKQVVQSQSKRKPNHAHR